MVQAWWTVVAVRRASLCVYCTSDRPYSHLPCVVATSSSFVALTRSVVPRFDEDNRRVRTLSCRVGLRARADRCCVGPCSRQDWCCHCLQVIARGVEQCDLAAASQGDGGGARSAAGGAPRRKRVCSTQWRLPGTLVWIVRVVAGCKFTATRVCGVQVLMSGNGLPQHCPERCVTPGQCRSTARASSTSWYL